jgi:hypothetical protein
VTPAPENPEPENPEPETAARPGPRGPDGGAPIDVDRELAEVERFIAAVQSGSVGTSQAMAAYRDRHRPAIDRLRQELDAFEALLAPDLERDPERGVAPDLERGVEPDA